MRSHDADAACTANMNVMGLTVRPISPHPPDPRAHYVSRVLVLCGGPSANVGPQHIRTVITSTHEWKESGKDGSKCEEGKAERNR